MEIDRVAGFPELPDGFYWRVEQDVSILWVYLMVKRREWRRDKVLRSEWRYMHYVRRVLERKGEGAVYGMIGSMAEDAYKNNERILESERVFEQLCGDYPPKRLGG